MAAKKPVITLITDFGLQDYFVSVMKGVILNLNPEVEIIDICHNIPPQDIFQAAYVLKRTYTYFPSGSIHVVVVDPGVGTDRKPILVSSENNYFVAPDNGVLSYIYAGDQDSRVREITADHYFLKPRSGTFDGRDVFAPVAAWLSKGVGVSAFGELLSEYKKFEIPQPALVQEGMLKCKIVYVDRFGNLVTNLNRERFKECLDSSEQRRFAFRVGEHTITRISQSYTEGDKYEIIAIFGSSDCVEFSVNRGSAARLSGLGTGKEILFKVA